MKIEITPLECKMLLSAAVSNMGADKDWFSDSEDGEKVHDKYYGAHDRSILEVWKNLIKKLGSAR